MPDRNDSQRAATSLVVKLFGKDGRETPLIVSKCDFSIGASMTADYAVKDGDLAPFHASFVFFQDKWYIKNTSGKNEGVVLNGKPIPQDMLSPLSPDDALVLGRSVRMSIGHINKPVEWQNKIQENTDDFGRTDHSSDETVIDAEYETDDNLMAPPPPPPLEAEDEEPEGFFQKYKKILWIIGGLLLVCLLVKVLSVLLH